MGMVDKKVQTVSFKQIRHLPKFWQTFADGRNRTLFEAEGGIGYLIAAAKINSGLHGCRIPFYVVDLNAANRKTFLPDGFDFFIDFPYGEVTPQQSNQLHPDPDGHCPQSSEAKVNVRLNRCDSGCPQGIQSFVKIPA